MTHRKYEGGHMSSCHLDYLQQAIAEKVSIA